jgi:hypothetical protein
VQHEIHDCLLVIRLLLYLVHVPLVQRQQILRLPTSHELVVPWQTELEGKRPKKQQNEKGYSSENEKCGSVGDKIN